jgi:hypothetical protein
MDVARQAKDTGGHAPTWGSDRVTASGLPTFADAAYAILRAQGRPLDTRTLLTLSLRAAGGQRPTARALAEVYAALNGDGRFRPVAPGTWGLTEWQREALGAWVDEGEADGVEGVDEG